LGLQALMGSGLHIIQGNRRGSRSTALLAAVAPTDKNTLLLQRVPFSAIAALALPFGSFVAATFANKLGG